MTIDPRLAERRKEVAEDKAVRNLSRLLRFLGALLVLGALVWLVLSPWLSVHQVRVAGVAVSDANSVLVDHRVVAGTPMIMLRPDTVETALKDDPWIRDARIHLDWPDEVVVQVIEREPVAWFNTAGGWQRRDINGVAVPGPDTPNPEMAWVLLPGLDEADAEGSSTVLGAAEFVAALPDDLRTDARLRVEEGEMWATVGGYEIRLGRPVEMAEKALSLVALLSEELPTDAVLVLVAPSHPAVRPGSDTAASQEPSEEPSEDSQDQASP